MTSQSKHTTAIKLMGAIVVAITNVKLYPPSSPLISNSLDKAYTLLSLYLKNGEFTITEVENAISISDKMLSSKNQQLPQVTSFRDAMKDTGLKNIRFMETNDKAEFRKFIYLMSKTPDEVDNEGGIEEVATKAGLKTIVLEHGTMGGSNSSFGSQGGKDNELLRGFTGERALNDTDFNTISEKALDPQWVNAIVKSGLEQLQSKGTTVLNESLSTNVGKMIDALKDSVGEQEKEFVSKNIADAVEDVDGELLGSVFADNYETGFFEPILDYFNDDQFVKLTAKVKHMADTGVADNKVLPPGDILKYEKAFEHLMSSDRANALADKIRRSIAVEKKKDEIRATRCEEGIEKIITGDKAPFVDPVVMQGLPGSVHQMYLAGDEVKAKTVIDRTAEGLLMDDASIRSEVAQAFFRIGDKFFSEHRREDMLKLAHKLNLWIKFETKMTPAYVPVCKLLCRHTGYLIDIFDFEEANAILETFSFIYTGKVKRSEDIVEQAYRFLRNLATQDVFELIFHEFNTDEHGQKKSAHYLLSRFGMFAVDRVLDELKDSEHMSDRVKLIKVVTETGAPALPSVIERIYQGGPWFYLRNLIKIIDELGGEDNLETLKLLLRNEDDRVKNAALNCAFDIGGESRAGFFLEALGQSAENIKHKIVDLLGKLRREEAVFPLTELLKKADTGSGDDKIALDKMICLALGKIGSKKAIPVLKAIANNKTIMGMESRTFSSELRTMAGEAIEAIREARPEPQSQSAPRKETTDRTLAEEVTSETTLDIDPGEMAEIIAPVSAMNVDETLKKIDAAVSDGRKRDAANMMYDVIVHHVKQKEFDLAEAFREKLFEIDSTAISMIVRAGELITKEKNTSIPSDYMELWAPLFSKLTEEEAGAFYYSLKTLELENDTPLIKQGAYNTNLYFVSRGQLKIVYRQGERESFLKMIGSGDIAGEDTFWPISVCTFSVVALSEVTVKYIERADLKSIEKRFPGIDAKVYEFASTADNLNDLARKRGMNRRHFARYDIKGQVITQLIDENNKPMGTPFKGKLIDISAGGFAFEIKTSKKETARRLLGRKVNSKVALQTGIGDDIELAKIVTIIGACQKNSDTFSIHLEFQKKIDDTKLRAIVKKIMGNNT